MIPRFVHTHMEYDRRRFGANRKLYLYRNPGDTMVSYFEYRRALRGEHQYRGTFKDFIRDDRYGVVAWCRHVKSWLGNADAIVTYEELNTDTFGSMKRIFELLNITGVEDGILKEAIRRSEFDKIREVEEKKGPEERGKRRLMPGARFARKGTVGQWREYFDGDDLEYLMDQVNRYDLSFVLPLP